jgi:hypothetical protein
LLVEDAGSMDARGFGELIWRREKNPEVLWVLQSVDWI